METEVRSQKLKTPKRSNKKKKTKGDSSEAAVGKPKKEKEIQHVICSFDEHQYNGTVRTDSIGARCLESQSAQYSWKNGPSYEGPFTASEIEGRGKFTWPDTSTYEGMIQNGRRHGDGVYIAADGVTKYDGQWHDGKRHGIGRITYDAQGAAYYLGQWEDGHKHGDGRQVWPSGNTYRGQWRLGKMAGQGSMTWCDAGLLEEYTGAWEDDHPQGSGKHTWHAPQSKEGLSGSAREMPSQQRNNCYEGEWHNGVRHGAGIFNYANGAKYSGSWQGNVKQGQGRHTFEDGKVYCGPFNNDQMTEMDLPTTGVLNRPALNIGAEDNPVRRCIDISDLQVFALPVDVGSHDLHVGSGYDESEEVMREVHNMLLRYLGELKQFYSAYRGIHQAAETDPFVLSMYQLWFFARDLDLITPSCSLSRLDRFWLSGPRHHQEACHDDVAETRPLTPRLMRRDSHGQRGSCIVPSAKGSVASPSGASRLSDRDSVSNKGAVIASGGGEDAVETSSVASSGVSPSQATEGVDADTAIEGDENDSPRGSAAPQPQGDQASAADSPQNKHGSMRASIAADMPEEQPLYSRFWRQEGGDDLVDIHDASGVLMFRHFLEGIVRAALARFPNEKGLETQIRRLFTEIIKPNIGTSSVSTSVFQFMTDVNTQQVFQDSKQTLWQCFKDNATGDGAYGRPLWAGPGDNQEEDAQVPARSTGGCRRGFGGQHRRVHVRARQDVTIRVKDLLRLFDVSGLLKPLNDSAALLPRGETDLYGALFPERMASRASSAESAGGMEPIEELGGLKDFFGVAGGGTSPGPLTLDAEGMAGLMQGASGGGREGSPSPLGRPTDGDGEQALAMTKTQSQQRQSIERSDGLASASNPQAVHNNLEDPIAPENLVAVADVEAAEAKLEEVLQCDFTMSFLSVLGCILEVCLPKSAEKIRWTLQAGTSPREELVALLDYLETEVNFAEFSRLLLRVGELQTQQASFTGRLPLHRRLEGFLKHVFFPALQGSRYEPPAPPAAPEVNVAPQVEAEQPQEPPTSEEVPPAAAQDGISGDAPPLEEASEPALPLNFWRGHDGGDGISSTEWCVAYAPRHWPAFYEKEISGW